MVLITETSDERTVDGALTETYLDGSSTVPCLVEKSDYYSDNSDTLWVPGSDLWASRGDEACWVELVSCDDAVGGTHPLIECYRDLASSTVGSWVCRAEAGAYTDEVVEANGAE